MTAEPTSELKIRIAAMDALARREHSRRELEDKLLSRFGGQPDTVKAVVDQLQSEGLQSDDRYVESFCRYRIGRGQGPARIVSELRYKGIPPAHVSSALEAMEVDWFALAMDVCRRRFGETPASDQRDSAKRFRFLQYRGFTSDQIRHALAAGTSE